MNNTLPREQDQRPIKKNKPKTTPCGLDDHNENIGSTIRADFNIRPEHKVALGRVPCDAPDSVRQTISRHKKQVRWFSEHAARPSEDTKYETGSDMPTVSSDSSVAVSVPITDSINTGLPASPKIKSVAPLNLKDGAESEHALLDRRRMPYLLNNATGSDATLTPVESSKSNSAIPNWFVEDKTDKPKPSISADSIPENQTLEQSRQPDVPPHMTSHDVQVGDSTASERTFLLKSSTLQEHKLHSAPDRPGQLRFGGSSAMHKNATKKKPTSPYTTKYIPSAMAAADSSIVPIRPSEASTPVNNDDRPSGEVKPNKSPPKPDKPLRSNDKSRRTDRFNQTIKRNTDKLATSGIPKAPPNDNTLSDITANDSSVVPARSSEDSSDTSTPVNNGDRPSGEVKPNKSPPKPDKPLRSNDKSRRTDRFNQTIKRNTDKPATSGTPKNLSQVKPTHLTDDKTTPTDIVKPDKSDITDRSDSNLSAKRLASDNGDKTVEPDLDTTKPGSGRGSPLSLSKKAGKLKFANEESVPSATAPTEKPPPGRKLTKAKAKAERSAGKLEAAQKKLPKKHSIRRERVVEEKSGKVKKKLRFETEVKSQHEHLKGSVIMRPVKFGANATILHAHRKLYQVEHENIGTQAAHRGEMLAEGGLRMLYRYHKTAPYRKVEKLTKKTTKLNIKTSYQQALNDNPKLKSNPLSHMAQKRKIKRQYAKSIREGEKTARRMKKTGKIIGKLGQAVIRAVTRHPAMFGILVALFLLVVMISSLFTSCSSILLSVGSSVSAISYMAEESDIDNAELYYTELETDLQIQISRAETDYPGYDEYRYQIGDIGHNPYEFMAYLTAMYQDFRYTDVEDDLRELFGEQYQLSFTPSVETHDSDPEDTDGDGDYGAYDWYVMTVTLTSHSFTDIVFTHMNTNQCQHYNLLIQSKGGRQYVGSPFDFNWLPYVTSYYGYRIHPTTGIKDYHRGIDIGVPTGTDVYAVHNGTITTGYNAGGYGYYITLTGSDGLVTKYAHLDRFLVCDGQTVNTGDVIAESGNSGNSTGSHLHFEVIRNGQYRNPIYFSQTNDSSVEPV